MTYYPPVILYSQPGCLPCKRIAAKLLDSGVHFEVIDLIEDDESRRYVVNELKATSTPVLTHPLSDYPIIGYQPDETDKLIATIKAHQLYREDGQWGDLIDPELIHDYVYEDDDA